MNKSVLKAAQSHTSNQDRQLGGSTVIIVIMRGAKSNIFTVRRSCVLMNCCHAYQMVYSAHSEERREFSWSCCSVQHHRQLLSSCSPDDTAERCPSTFRGLISGVMDMQIVQCIPNSKQTIEDSHNSV